MKKFVLSVLLLAAPFMTFAQLNVYNSGRVGIATLQEFSYSKLAIGQKTDTGYSGYDFNLFARNLVNTSASYYIGVNGEAYPSVTTNSGRAIGVRGIATGTTSGYNYGVLGSVMTSGNGAAVLGTIDNVLGVYVSGLYAGYFNGAVKVTGTLTAASVVTPSDIRLKENISVLGETEGSSTLSRLKDLNVISYTYKEQETEKSDTATTTPSQSREEKVGASQKQHIGLIAQELQEAYPELVVEGQDGYLGVNYVELVPVLLQSIKELNAKIERLENGEQMQSGVYPKAAPAKTAGLEDFDANTTTSLLMQNSPNPFTERTVIRFALPEDAQNAYIYVFDMTGKMQKQIPVNSSMDSVTINGYELSAGMYIYSLVVNGKEVDTKRMILSK